MKDEARKTCSLLVTGGFVVTMNPHLQVFLDGAIAVEDDRISAVGDRSVIERAYTGSRIIDAADGIVFPGFVNAHTHAFQTLYRGLGDDMGVLDWVQRMIFPLSRNLRAREASIGTRLACVEMIKSGITCFADSFYVTHDPESVNSVAQAIVDSGMRGVLARACSDTGERPPEFLETPAVAADETEEAIRHWNGLGNGRVSVCPEALFTLFATPELIASLRGVAARYSTGFHMHAGESMDEAAQIRRKTGKTVFSYLDSVDALGPGVLIHHAVWCTDADIHILAERQTAISHNPVSNQYLAAGIAPVQRMLELGVTVGLGTDGAASNNSQDYIQVLKAAVLLQKVAQLNPEALTAETALELATLHGSRALGLSSAIGSLEPGKKADITIVDLSAPNATPAHKPVSTVVFSSSAADVRTVIVDGQVLMENRKLKTIDETEVLSDAREAGARLLERSNSGHLLKTGRFQYVGAGAADAPSGLLGARHNS